MNPILIVMIAQTIVYAGTLIVLILQVRAQVLAIRASQYANCQADYSSLIRMLVQQGELQSIYDDLCKSRPDFKDWKWSRYSKRQKTLYNYIELNYELFERVFYLHKNKWIDDETWANWETWLNELCTHPIFSDVMKDNEEMFGSEFERFINEKIISLRDKSTQKR